MNTVSARSNERIWIIALGILLTICHACAENINVFAAASLTDALHEISSGYEKQSGDRIVLNTGASSTLARQIEEGAPADIFFSADEAKMNDLEAKGFIAEGTRKSLLSNLLVIVVASDATVLIREPKDLANPAVKRIALGNPRAVPIGIYAKQYLEGLNLWDAVVTKIVATENVRAALAAVEAGNADASIVYKTDAKISRKVRVVFEVPAEKGPRISYPMAIVKETRKRKPADKFLMYLSSEEAGKVFTKYGFIVKASPN